MQHWPVIATTRVQHLVTRDHRNVTLKTTGVETWKFVEYVPLRWWRKVIELRREKRFSTYQTIFAERLLHAEHRSQCHFFTIGQPSPKFG